MDPQRWQQIETLLQAALDLDPRERRSFLDKTCGVDMELRREVELLLSREAEAALLDRSPAATLLPASLSGRTISHYRIARRIGAGGMGEVYEAHDENLQRTVALKVLPEEFTNDAERIRRFEQEAFAASRLNHPNIITIFEILRSDGAHFMATELVEGRTLREILDDAETHTLPPERALDVAIQVATALKAAHTAWIIHRDIKPENIMVRSDGVVKVLDFGIAKRSDEPSEDDFRPRDQPLLQSPNSFTVPGAVLGTASYMSPEQARGEPLDGRTDLYSLGLVLREMLPPTSDEIQQVVRKLLQPNREDRHSSAAELLDDLHRVRRRLDSRTARRMVRFSAMAVVAAIAATGIAAFLSVHETWEERVLRDGHTAAARRAVFSPDGRYVVSCGEDGRIFVWDFARRERLRTLSGPASQTVDYSPDGRWLAVGGADGSITIWDAARWSVAHVLRGHRSRVTGLAFSPDVSRLASGSAWETILWDTSRWQQIRRWNVGTMHLNFVFRPQALVVSPNVTWLDLQGDRIRTLAEDVGANWMALSPDGKELATISPHGEVSFYRIDDRALANPLALVARSNAHQDHGRGIAWSPNGRLVVSAADDILLWDPVTQTKIARFGYSSIVWSVAFSPDGRWLLSTHGDGAVLIWDVAERKCIGSLNEHSAAVRAVALSPDGTRVASASEDSIVTVWDSARGHKMAVLAGHETRVNGVAFSLDGSLLASVDQNGVTILWDIGNRKPARVFREPVNNPNYCVAISPDRRFLATTNGVLTREGRMLLDLRQVPPCGQAYGAAFSANGEILATVFSEGCLLLWDGRSFRRLVKATVPATHLIAVAFSPDGQWLVTGEDEGAVRLWSVQPLREIAVLGRHAARVKSVAFAPDGLTVASAGDDKMIALWDVRRRKLRTRIGTHATPVYSIAFSSDGRRLVSGEHDRSVRIYTRQRTLWGILLD